METLEIVGTTVKGYGNRLLLKQAVEYSIVNTKSGALLCMFSSVGLLYTGFSGYKNDICIEDCKHLHLVRNDARGIKLFQSYCSGKPLNETLHLIGTAFSIEVWRHLLRIPCSHLISYKELAQKTGHPKAVRATAHAVARNPVSIIIPCHRVIYSNGEKGKYHWGSQLKKEMIENELCGKCAILLLSEGNNPL